MNPAPFFALQFFWFLLAWTVVVVSFVRPRLRDCPADDALAIWLAPQLFRVLGIGLLVPNLSPGMPASFAIPTAVGDCLTAVLALVSVLALRGRWPGARRLAWTCTAVGISDLLIALPHAVTVEAARFMATQWYVPTLGLPLLIVCHVMALRNLLRVDHATARG